MYWAMVAGATKRRAAGSGDGPDVPDETSGASASASAASEVPTEADRLEALGDRICQLSAHIDAAQRELLALVAEFDRLGGWKAGGHRSCAKWLTLRTGRAPGRAREQVRVARALEDLPATGEAMGRGRLSFDQARTLTRVADADTEDDLLELAEGATIGQLRRMARAWKQGSREDEAARERKRHRRRRFSVFPDDDGMGVARGKLMPEVTAVFMRALEKATDALYREEERDDADPPLSPRARRREAARRRADAVGLVAERALAAGFGGEDAPISGSRAERYLAFVHVDAATLAEEGEPGRSELEDGTRLSAETARRLVCDVSKVDVLRGEEGSVLDVGRKHRTTPPALRRALEVRDRGCRFPGCGLRFTDAHHIKHWSDGGETSLENMLLLCRFHHRLVHEEGWTVQWWGKTRAVFTDPRGHHHLNERPAPPEVPERPVQALVRENRRRGVDPGPLEAGARWKRERDIPDRVYFGALEAGFAARSPP